MSTKKKPTASTTSTHLDGSTPVQAHHLLKAQQQIAEEVQNFTSRWTERRREAVRTLLKASGDLSPSAKAPTTIPEIMQNWQETSAQCMSEDSSDGRAWWSTCSHIVTSGEMDVVSALATAAGLTNKPDKLPTRIPV